VTLRVPNVGCKLRCAPVLQEKGKRGRPPKHGAVLHPGSESPEIDPLEDFTVIEEEKEIRVRRWNQLHFEDFAQTILDVVRVDHPEIILTMTVLYSLGLWRGS